jgi:hypothetical protein
MKKAATAGAEETVAAIGQLLVCPTGSIEPDEDEESAKAMFNLPAHEKRRNQYGVSYWLRQTAPGQVARWSALEPSLLKD